MKRSDFWTTAKQNWRALVYLLVLTVLAVVLVVVCVRRGQDAAQPSPTPRTSAEVRKDAAQTLLDGMTTQEKICQLLIVHPEALTGGSTVTGMTDELTAALREYPVGGVLLSAGNMTSGEQLAALTAALSNGGKTAPLISVDEEGGRVARLMNTVGTTKLGSMYSYRAQGTQGAHDNAQTIARDIAAYGFNTDFAPVADVWTNKRSNAIGDRAYSDDYDEAAELVAAAVKGFHDGGVICCLKHFPGHGSTAADSHDGAATVEMFKRGELTGTSLTGDQVEHYMQDPEWGQYVTLRDKSSVNFWFFPNFESPNSEFNAFVQNEDFRLALYHALDRVTIAQLYNPYDTEDMLTNLICPEDVCYDENGIDYTDYAPLKEIKERGAATYDPALAKEYFEKALSAATSTVRRQARSRWAAPSRSRPTVSCRSSWSTYTARPPTRSPWRRSSK